MFNLYGIKVFITIIKLSEDKITVIDSIVYLAFL